MRWVKLMLNTKITKYANCLCIGRFLKIGGVEQVAFEIAYKCKTEGYDLTIFYVDGDLAQIRRLEELLGKDKVIQYDGRIIYCDVAFFNYDISYIDNVLAKNYYEVIHANFDIERRYKPHLNDKITEYLAVSKIAREGFIKATKGKVKPKVCYSPLSIREEDKEKVLILISCTRLSSEKGKENMIALANELDKHNKKYIWFVFTNDTDIIKNPNVIYMKPRLDIRPYMLIADYVVQLSKTEGRCTTILEALNLGKPVIVSDIEAFREMGVNKNNGFILPIPIKNVPIDEIYTKTFNIKYNNKKDGYDKYLSKEKTHEEEIKVVKVKTKEIRKGWFDTIEKVHVVPRGQNITVRVNANGERFINMGETYETSEERAKILIKAGYCEIAKPEVRAKRPKSKTDVKKVK